MNHEQDIEHWRQQRLARLTAADGWLTLIGLPWLQPGLNRIGSGADQDVVVPGLQEHFGTLERRPNGRVYLQLADAGSARIDGPTGPDGELLDDAFPQASVVRCGTVSFFVVRRGDNVGLRVRDSQAGTRTDFLGLDHFPIDPAWRIEAEWRMPGVGEVLPMSTVIGTLEDYPVAGHAVFEKDGLACTLLPVLESPGDESFFVVFADQTSGKETYGAARFVYTEPPRNGRIVIDFNKAYNPPCAFTAYATCPMAPPENRLPVRVEAGELAYRGSPVHP